MPTIAGFSRAAVFRAPRQPLEIETFPLPIPNGREAIVRILCSTICGSDLHSYYGRRHSPAPSVLGHEMVGEMYAIGPAGAYDFRGNSLALGDRVTWSIVWSCGACFYCTRGLRPKCEHLMKFGHEAIAPGRDLIGGFAEYCILREGTAIFRVPANIPDVVASPANCATATVAAVFRNAGPVDDQTVIVIGAGMLGLTACAMASARNAAQVIAIDTNPERCELAGHFGSTLILDGRAPAAEIRHRVLDVTKGRGADILLEFSSMPEAIECGFDLLRFGGRLVLAGSTLPTRPVQMPAEAIVRRLIQIVGVYNYQPEDLGEALDFLSDNISRYPFHELVGPAFPLNQAQAAVEFAESARPPRVAIIPSLESQELNS